MTTNRKLRATPGINSHHEILVDGHGTVSYQMFDAHGDNALVYLTRRQTRDIAKRLLRASEVKHR